MIIEKCELPPVPFSEKNYQVQPSHEEQPPPYVRGSSSPAFSSGSQNGSLADSVSRCNLFQSAVQQQVNNIYLESRHNQIIGSYILNAELPVTSPLGLNCSRRHQFPSKGLDKKNWRIIKQPFTPNAFFQTRHGSISLNLATAGFSDAGTRTNVQAKTRHGKINVNLFSLQPKKRICLEVASRHGNIVVFIPPNFDGALTIRSRRGNVNFLPAFARSARTVSGNDKESFVLFGEGNYSPADLATDYIDSCFLSTRTGKITIGVSGVDRFDEANVGDKIVEKLGSLSLMFLGTDVTK
ncbi:hypothetical protein NLI96_g2683 [Meripilus lineatus]|uniref:DUF7330 domain-containing protein n=1 Tax=Meripilus lineatus TaxID=2056292 RepID=A0AAD5YLR3_9APHY|nr:hypothetical protein NLI96_g2683 [Physisporinus lineatus]